MKEKYKIIFNIVSLFGMTLSVFFLSGCFFGNQPREQVLRNAEEYNVRSYQDRNADNSPATHRLSVGAPPRDVGTEEHNPTEDNNSSKNKQMPAMQIDASKNYSAVLKTGAGDITIDLDTGKTPAAANNFVTLAREKFFDGTIFHRAIKGFMIQGGDPRGDGTGGPGYKFADENLEGEYTRGAVAMANSGPDTNGSQFFIMHQDYDLPNSYVIFGHVSGGMEVVDKIATADVAASTSGENSRPLNPVKIESVEIVEK